MFRNFTLSPILSMSDKWSFYSCVLDQARCFVNEIPISSRAAGCFKAHGRKKCHLITTAGENSPAQGI